MPPRWGFAVVVAVAYRAAPVAEALEHTTVTAAVVAHRVAFAVGTGNSAMVAALHTGWAVAAALPESFHSWCKIADRR